MGGVIYALDITSWENKIDCFHSVFFFSVHIYFAHVCLHLVSKLEKYSHVSCISLFCFKGVMNWETEIPLMFWHIRGHFALKTPCKFQNSTLWVHLNQLPSSRALKSLHHIHKCFILVKHFVLLHVLTTFHLNINYKCYLEVVHYLSSDVCLCCNILRKRLSF